MPCEGASRTRTSTRRPSPAGRSGARSVTDPALPQRRRDVTRRRCVVSQFETVTTQSPPIHRAGGVGGALGNPIGLSGPPPACRLPVRLSRRTTTGFPRPPPPPPPPPP